ncbi:MAG TPA: hypothetical protein PLH23_16035 [Hyphomonadaceae bacterium]|nr:hypothetical protein [Hyphomonadaceae bacterium]HPI49783.1 hypothetical protein [Hyphomonadaceae bacterium]
MPVEIKFEIDELKFAKQMPNADPYALVVGRLRAGDSTANVSLAVRPQADGVTWQSVFLNHDNQALMATVPMVAAEKMVGFSARFLTPITLWFGQQNEQGSQLYLKVGPAPAEADGRVAFSNRNEALKLPGPAWNLLWERIKDRVRYDEQFSVRGFGSEDILASIEVLRQVFPHEWVKARYARAGYSKMGDPLPQDAPDWFPAFLFARTALGSICVDPAWNYLVEIGLAVRDLAGFAGLQRLKVQLTRSPGTQHHLCMAAELQARGLLLGLEPGTGAGATKDDLLVGAAAAPYQVELKEFRSNTPSRNFENELRLKVQTLPNEPPRPVVFHVVLSETRDLEKEREKEFTERIGLLEIPPQISAVVVGRRFIDSSGGRVKRDLISTRLNPNALKPANAETLADIFRPNFNELAFPVHALGSTMMVGPAEDNAFKIEP